METKTEPTKPQTKSIDLVNPVELSKINPPTQTTPPATTPAVPTKPAAKPPALKPEAKPPTPALAEFAAFLDKAPKEHLPTMMVRIANKCMAEKVFATPGAMAEAIVGASRK